MDEDVLALAEQISLELHGRAMDVAISALALVTAGVIEQAGMTREVYSQMLRVASERSEEVQA